MFSKIKFLLIRSVPCFKTYRVFNYFILKMENALVQERHGWRQITIMILLGLISAATLIAMASLASIQDPSDDWNIAIGVCSAVLIILITTLIVLMIIDKAKWIRDYHVGLLMWNWFIMSAFPVTALVFTKYQKFAICVPVFVGVGIVLNEICKRLRSGINAAGATQSLRTLTTPDIDGDQIGETEDLEEHVLASDIDSLSETSLFTYSSILEEPITGIRSPDDDGTTSETNSTIQTIIPKKEEGGSLPKSETSPSTKSSIREEPIDDEMQIFKPRIEDEIVELQANINMQRDGGSSNHEEHSIAVVEKKILGEGMEPLPKSDINTQSETNRSTQSPITEEHVTNVHQITGTITLGESFASPVTNIQSETSSSTDLPIVLPTTEEMQNLVAKIGCEIMALIDNMKMNGEDNSSSCEANGFGEKMAESDINTKSETSLSTRPPNHEEHITDVLPRVEEGTTK